MQDSGPHSLSIRGMVGMCGSERVFLGFARADELSRHSFPDVLDEQTGQGYQRRFSPQHSLEFRKYIQKAGSSTIPLTFNLRPSADHRWSVEEHADGTAVLTLDNTLGPVMAQVDCQHRLGFLKDVPVPLAFMSFIGLSMKDEMRVFNVINSKAKGLSSSLLDYHESKLTDDLSAANPEIFIALQLHELPESPWYTRLDLGGSRPVGMKRYASLRTMQNAVRRFLRTSKVLDDRTPAEASRIVVAYWCSVRNVLSDQWADPRRHLLTKGIGVYALMSIAGDLVLDARKSALTCDESYFTGALSDFAGAIDWSTRGPLHGFGGVAGADKAFDLLRSARAKAKLKVVSRG